VQGLELLDLVGMGVCRLTTIIQHSMKKQRKFWKNWDLEHPEPPFPFDPELDAPEMNGGSIKNS